MLYDPIKNALIIEIKDVQRAAHSIRYTIAHIRKLAKMPLRGFKHQSGPMTDSEFAESALLDLAKELGIEIGATRYGELDVRSELSNDPESKE